MSSKGFTLVEAVLAVGLVAAGLTGLLIVFQGAARSNALADQTVIATNIARGTLEQVITQRDSVGYTAAISSIATGTYDDDPISGLPGFALDTTALEVNPDVDAGSDDDFLDASLGSGVARVTARVEWNDGRNSIQLVTLITNYTL